MPRDGVGNPGNVGGGRKSARDERLVMDVINKSWERVKVNLEGSRTTEEQKDMIALEVVKRTAPKSVDLTSLGEKIVSPIYAGESTKTVQELPRNEEDISFEQKN